MSLLDDLNQQAEKRQQQLQDDENHQKQVQETYEKHIDPRLRKLYHYLSEVVSKLNFIDSPIYCTYRIPGAGLVKDYYHSNYRVAADNSEHIREINLTFLCQRDRAVEFLVSDNSKLENIRNELYRHGINFRQQQQFDHRRGTLISLEKQIPVQIRIFVEENAIDIRLEISNIPGLGVSRQKIRPHELDQDFMENLGYFILRKPNNILEHEFSGEQKTPTPEKTEQQETSVPAFSYAPQENKAPKPGLFKRLFSRHQTIKK